MFFYIKTLGCKVNQYESEEAEKLLISHGHSLAADPSIAQLVIVNTCSVTLMADKKSRQQISKALNLSKKAQILVTGCMVENPESKETLKKCQYVHKDKLLAMLTSSYCNNKSVKECSLGSTPIKKIRKMIKVQDGCDYFCNYCIIPHLRSNKYSVEPKQILEEIENELTKGIKEFVLTGINLGTYNYDEKDLVWLLKKIGAIDGEFRIRLSSIEPNLLKENILDLYKDNQKLDRHFHVPLQAATDEMLKKMNRKYSLRDYLVLAEKIAEAGCTLTTDIIIGLPGETEYDFLKTIELINKGIFFDAHLFPYSPRKGTPAITFPDQVPEQVKKERVNQALFEIRKQKRKYFKSMEGKSCTVLIEQRKDSLFNGYSEYYFKVKLSTLQDSSFGSFVKVVLNNNEYFDGDEIVFGEMTQSKPVRV